MTQRILTDLDMAGNKIFNLSDATLPQQPATLRQLQAISYKKYATDIGDGSKTTITVQHGLGTRDILVQVRESATPYRLILPDAIYVSSINGIVLEFLLPPDKNAYRVTILG